MTDRRQIHRLAGHLEYSEDELEISVPHQRDIRHDDDEDDEPRCGWRCVAPQCLQCINKPQALLMCVSWFCIVQGFVVNGIVNINTAVIERRFHLPSAKVGLISSVYNVAAGLVAMPVSYLATYYHKPRMLAVTSAVMALGSFTMALPHFISKPYNLLGNTADSTKCKLNGSWSICHDDHGLSSMLYVFLAGQVLHGIGGSTLYTAGPALLDENVDAKVSPLYVGAMTAAGGVGPALGYLVGGQFLDVYVDIDRVNISRFGISPGDARWVGAWWIGFLVSGCLALSVSFCMSCFPRETRTGRRLRKYKMYHVTEKNINSDNGTWRKFTRDMSKAYATTLKNPTYLLITVAGMLISALLGGFAMFLPKLIQSQYGKTASQAAVITGLVVVPGAVCGQITGGIILRCSGLKVRGMLRMCMLTCMIAALTSLGFLMRCPSAPFAGINTHYTENTLSRNNVTALSSACNKQCGCSTYIYQPVCGADGVQYFSPCHAGCQSTISSSQEMVFSKCSCIRNPHITLPPGVQEQNYTGWAVHGGCPAVCHQMSLFLPLLFVAIFSIGITITSAISATLRCVTDKQRPIALGMQGLLGRFLGNVPMPILMGFLFDKSCQVWQDKCDGRGACWLYRGAELGRGLSVLAVLLCVGACLAFTGAQYCHTAARRRAEQTSQKSYTDRRDGEDSA